MQLQSSNNGRRRGVTLTAQGSRKLNQAKAGVEIEQNFKRYTLEALSNQTGLTPNTLSKVFIGTTRVDRRTLQCCFEAFNLTLETEDYCLEYPDDYPLKTLCETIHATQTPRSPTALTGQFPLASSFYINRSPLESPCYEAIEQLGVLLNLCAPKQMGKTSLLARILAHAKTLGYQTISLNLQLADAETFQELDRFLQWFCAKVSKQLDLPNAHSPMANVRLGLANFGNNHLGSKSNATHDLEYLLLANGKCPLVIVIDELSQLFAYPDIAREVLELLRVWSEQAKASDENSNPWHNLRLVTAHSTEILMPVSIAPSLLNTGLTIQLPKFTPAQVQDLAQRWQQEITKQQIEQLIALLGGHPYRLQLSFYHLDRQEGCRPN